MSELLDSSFVVTKIDVDEMEGGKAVAEKLRKGNTGGGIPWIVILDADGKELVTSDSPGGNIGCPVQPAEVDWFMQMISKTATELDGDELDALRAELEEFAGKHRR